jgi:catechol 2,3-dioxygenase
MQTIDTKLAAEQSTPPPLRWPMEISSVHLVVRTLDEAVPFYETLLLSPFERRGSDMAQALLGDSMHTLTLTAKPGGRRRERGTTGLFHIAFLFPDRSALGRALQRAMGAGFSFQGFADHGVSEAVYLADPDGNGIELYADRPQEQWRRDGNTVHMVTEPLDAEALLHAAESRTGSADLPPSIGHIHLQVADLRRGEEFYSDLLGFDVTQRDYPGALFLSSGGYHHHIGLNTWAGRSAHPPSSDMFGLKEFSVTVNDDRLWSSLLKQAHQTGGDNVIRLSDADGNAVQLLRGTSISSQPLSNQSLTKHKG